MIVADPAELFGGVNLTDASNVCHIANTPTQAVCGESIDPAEPLCCDDALPCGRVACPTCDRLVVETVNA